jgi:hypothetical protein
MMYIWHEWKQHRDHLKSLEAERKAANKRIWKNMNEELRVARKNRDWEKANCLKVEISNYKYEKGGQWGLNLPFDGRHGFSKWDK